MWLLLLSTMGSIYWNQKETEEDSVPKRRSGKSRSENRILPMGDKKATEHVFTRKTWRKQSSGLSMIRESGEPLEPPESVAGRFTKQEVVGLAGNKEDKGVCLASVHSD